MNFLAHLFLSGKNNELLVGNFLADFIGNAALESLPYGIQNGVLLHRQIDSFTDKHAIVLHGTRRLYDYHRKYASVIIDVFYDYFLASNWSNYNEESMEDFTGNVYEVLLEYKNIMPLEIGRRLGKMVEDNWLLKYTNKKATRVQNIHQLQATMTQSHF